MLMLGDEVRKRGVVRVRRGRIERAAIRLGRRIADFATRVVAGPEADAAQRLAGAVGARF